MTRALIAACAAAFLSGCTADIPEPTSAGAKLYAQRCAGCHALHMPGSMPIAMWKVQIKRMQGEMARRGVPPLSRDEERLLVDYLERHAQ